MNLVPLMISGTLHWGVPMGHTVSASSMPVGSRWWFSWYTFKATSSGWLKAVIEGVV